MRKSIFYIYITAVAALVCLCGILFALAAPMTSPEPSTVSKEFVSDTKFSLEKARALMNFSCASYSPDTLEGLLTNAGYSGFEYFTRENSADGIAAGIAMKADGESTEIAVVFRGTYKEEWYSNFNIGEDVEHKGFSAAAEYCEKKIEDYLTRHKKNASDINLKLTGHSRGGAVANLTAKYFIDKGTFKTICAYTFASPNTTTSENAHSPAYSSIYNIMNTEDFVCYIPLARWGYTKYGVNLELPKTGSEGHTEGFSFVNEKFYEFTGKNFSAYKNGYKDIENFIAACEDIAPTLWDYYNKEIILEPYTITLSEYMNSAATLLSGKKTISDALLLVSGSNSETLAPVTNFIMAGINPAEIDENTNLTDSPLGCGHACETYSAWLEALDEEYFLSKLPE